MGEEGLGGGARGKSAEWAIKRKINQGLVWEVNPIQTGKTCLAKGKTFIMREEGGAAQICSCGGRKFLGFGGVRGLKTAHLREKKKTPPSGVKGHTAK